MSAKVGIFDLKWDFPSATQDCARPTELTYSLVWQATMDPPPYTLDGLDSAIDGLNIGAEASGDRLIIALDFGTTYSG
jgi:hypothetical protein